MRKINNAFIVGLLGFFLAACNDTRSLDPDRASADSGAKATETKPLPAPPVVKTTIPEGTKFSVTLNDAVSSNKSNPGDEFTASLAEPIVVGGKTVLAKGAPVTGRVVDAKESGRVKGLASIQLVLTSVDHSGKAVAIETDTYVGIANNTKKRDAEIVGGAAGVGAIVGAVTGGAKGAAKGATIGAGAGTGTVLVTKGKEVQYPPETRLSFSLASPVVI